MSKVIQKAIGKEVGVLDYYDATHILNAPFTVILRNSVKQRPTYALGSESEVMIPDPNGLIKAVAQTRVLHPQKLAGPDIHFLRSALGLKGKDFAKAMNVTPEHLSRLESGDKTLSPQTEMLVRVYTFAATIPFTSKKEANGEQIAKLVEEFFVKLDISPVRLADQGLEFSFHRVARIKAGAEHCCLPDDGLWEPPTEPIAA